MCLFFSRLEVLQLMPGRPSTAHNGFDPSPIFFARESSRICGFHTHFDLFNPGRPTVVSRRVGAPIAYLLRDHPHFSPVSARLYKLLAVKTSSAAPFPERFPPIQPQLVPHSRNSSPSQRRLFAPSTPAPLPQLSFHNYQNFLNDRFFHPKLQYVPAPPPPPLSRHRAAHFLREEICQRNKTTYTIYFLASPPPRVFLAPIALKYPFSTWPSVFDAPSSSPQ